MVRRRGDELAPLIRAVRRRGDRVVAGELERYASRLGELTPDERAAVEALARGIVAKLLHDPIVELKERSEPGTEGLHAKVLAELLGHRPRGGVRPLRIGTRRSKLAVVQAELIREALADERRRRRARAHVHLGRRGRRRRRRPPRASRACGSTRSSTRLESEHIDLAVHSAKDLPADDEDGFVVAAVPRACGPVRRADHARGVAAARRRDRHVVVAPAGAAARRVPGSCGRRAPRQRRHAPAQARGRRGRRSDPGRGGARAARDRRPRSPGRCRSRRWCPRPGKAASPSSAATTTTRTRALLAPLDHPASHTAPSTPSDR